MTAPTMIQNHGCHQINRCGIRKKAMIANPIVIALGHVKNASVSIALIQESAVEAFHRVALAAGGRDDGAPGRRPQYSDGYYAAFIRDPDGNRIEAVTFLNP